LQLPGLTKLHQSIILIAGLRKRERLHIVFRLCELLGTLVSDRFDSSHNVRIRAATADIAAHGFSDVVILRPNRFTQQGGRRHDLARGAVSALKCVMLYKGGLDRMQRPTFRETFDRGDLVDFVHHGKRKTRIDASSVHVHGARAALAVVTALLGSRHSKLLPERVEQSCASIHRELMCSAVDLKPN